MQCFARHALAERPTPTMRAQFEQLVLRADGMPLPTSLGRGRHAGHIGRASDRSVSSDRRAPVELERHAEPVVVGRPCELSVA